MWRSSDSVRPWNSLNPDEKRLFARMAEVYAGFSEFTDACCASFSMTMMASLGLATIRM